MIVSECCGAISSTELIDETSFLDGDQIFLGLCSLCLEHSSFREEDEND